MLSKARACARSKKNLPRRQALGSRRRRLRGISRRHAAMLIIQIIGSTNSNFDTCKYPSHTINMASSEIIVIDDSSDDEDPPPRPTAAAAAAAAAAGGGASAKRARVDPTSTPADSDVPAIITPSFTGASTTASANTAHTAAASAASNQSPVTGSGVATTSAKKRPSPTLGHEARLLDPALQRADGGGASTGKSSKEETVEISDPRHTIVDILGNCHAKISFGAGRSPMPPNAIMGLPGLSVNGVGPIALPLLPAQASSLAAQGTLHAIRDAPLYQWLPNEVQFANPAFKASLDRALADACEQLRIDHSKVSIDLYKMLLHTHGDEARTLHLRSNAPAGSIASLVLMPPAIYTGGRVTIKRQGSTVPEIFNFSAQNSYDYAYFSLFNCAAYDVEPLETGSRLMFVFNIIQNDVAAAFATKATKIPPRIQYRDAAQIRRELLAATQQWDTTKTTPSCIPGGADLRNQRQIVLMLENQYGSMQPGKAPAKSQFKSTDRKIIEMLQESIREGANLDWCFGRVTYKLNGKGEKNPDRSTSVSAPEYVFDRITKEEIEINIGQFGTATFTKHGDSSLLKQELVYPPEYFEKQTPNDTFNQRYSYYDDESRIEANRKYASRSCLYIWPRSQTYCSTFKQASNSYESIKKLVSYVNDSSRSRFSGAIQLQNNQNLLDDFVKNAYAYDLKNHVSDIAALIVRFDAIGAANSFLGTLSNHSECRDEIREKALPLLFEHFEASVFAEKLSSVVKSMYMESAAAFVLKILAVECKSMSANMRVHPCKKLLFMLSKRCYDKGSHHTDRYRVREFARLLGCKEDEYGYYGSSGQWPRHSVSDILVKLCENYHVMEEMESEISDTGNGTSNSDNPIPKSPFQLFIAGVVGALSWNKSATASTFERIQEKFCPKDLNRVGKTLALTEAGCNLLGRSFVEGTPLEVATELTVLVTKEAKKDESGGADSASIDDDDILDSAVNLFAWPLLKGVAKLVAPSFAISLMRRVNEEGSKGRHKELGKALRGVNGLGLDEFICYLCSMTTNDTVTVPDGKDMATPSSEDIATLFCSLGSSFVEQSTPQDRDIFSRLMSKPCLTAVFARCGQEILSARIKGWQDTLALGPAAGIVLQLCELGEAPSSADSATDSSSAAAASSAKASEVSLLSQEFLSSFAKRVISSSQTSLTDSLSTQKNRSSYMHDDEPANNVWPANSIGKIIKYLHETSSVETCTTSSGKGTAGEGASIDLDGPKFLSATFEGLARDRSTATVKTESGAKTSAKRLLCTNDAALAFQRIGLPGVTQILEGVMSRLPFAPSSEFLLSLQSGDRRAKSSAASLGLITSDALKLIAPDTEADGLKVKLLLAFIEKRVVGTGRAHFVSLAANLQQQPAFPRSILGFLCRNEASSAAIKSQDVTGFLSAICSAITHGLQFHENTFISGDFSTAIAKAGGDFNVMSGLFSPVITSLTTDGRSADAIYLLHLLLSNAPSAVALNACATLNLGRIVLKVLEMNNVGSTAKLSIENRAFATLMFWVAHFEGSAPAILRASLVTARAPRPLEAAFTAPLVCSTQLVSRLFTLGLQETSQFLAEADTLLSSSAAESKSLASVRVSALFEQVASRAVTTAEKEINNGPPRPTASYRLVSDTDPLGYYGSDYRSFLANPCSTARIHESKLKQSWHSRVRNDLRSLINKGEISVTFNQAYPGRPYYVRIEKLKMKALPSTSIVPSCRCGRATCELNRYQKGEYTGERAITQHFIDGLKETRGILSKRAKGIRVAPEVEFVPNEPKPIAEVVDLLE